MGCSIYGICREIKRKILWAAMSTASQITLFSRRNTEEDQLLLWICREIHSDHGVFYMETFSLITSFSLIEASLVHLMI